MNPMQTDHNKNQLRLMKNLIVLLEEDKIDIRRLIDQLDALFSTLENVPKDWENAFRSAWAKLEVAYSIYLDQESEDTEELDPIIEDALKDLSCLLDS